MAADWACVEAPEPLGGVSVAVTAAGAAAVSFSPRPPDGADPRLAAAPPAGEERAALVARQVAEYLAGRRRAFDFPVDWGLTAGPQRTVLQTLHRTVGYGRTVTYGELAAASGVYDDVAPGERWAGARGVGQIMGSNPLALIVPCHRVVAADGLGGYGGGYGGVGTKRWLLTLEGVLAPTLDWNGPG
ncbi:methylated-DNA--[protein]-cysteine S-methyltransferase [Streptacidiphilus sp. ASG 303]|uniref:methylated-DNA--[protein]-cysteine S-methyltransferase n=1 Tax=Streptomycetaceae TaxID=2062 RepID=UPI001E34B21A|nr:methylated-DNA--[protein]-cysteine S-methyltransferase [Streptacidiphilus sp. ASG 303]MCD0483484.1 methylated-DNA--[protein]-cysteine S-methyltransferase [Streptacidiphilus sp. ASG 303]